MMMMMGSSSAAQGQGASFHRSDRVRKALMREVADIIATGLKDPRLDGVVISVTDVEVTLDLSVAKVYLSILAEALKQQEVMKALVESQPKIRKAVGQRIRLRHTPEVLLKLDTSLERGVRMNQLLDKIAQDENL